MASALAVLWGLSGWSLIVAWVALGAAAVVRVVERFVPEGWCRFSGPLVLAAVVGYLVWTAETVFAVGVATGVAAVVVVVLRWRRWQPVAVAALLLVGSAAGYGVWQYQEAHRPLLTPDEHEFNVSMLRLREPRLFAQRLNSAVLVGDEWGVCFMFSDDARAQFTASIPGAASCEDAVRRMREQIRDPRKYEYPSWDSSALQVNSKTATFNLCEVYWGDVFSGARHDVGPKFGRLTLTNPVGPGWIISDYEPCPSQ
ncbi:hypothetical protein AB0A74_22900 [Saccharothrix sp. NPDC042600]|uniref:hypothetical protein n=1 Tax=Saccharothrix TaxID=2071 RepID=UPI0033D256F8